MPRFNERELFLLQNWADAKLLADDMGKTRSKFEKILDEVLNTFRKNHGDLDWPFKDQGQLGIGKRKSPNDGTPSGLYIQNLDLENVTGMHSPDLEAPQKAVVILHSDQEATK